MKTFKQFIKEGSFERGVAGLARMGARAIFGSGRRNNLTVELKLLLYQKVIHIQLKKSQPNLQRHHHITLHLQDLI